MFSQLLSLCAGIALGTIFFSKTSYGQALFTADDFDFHVYLDDLEQVIFYWTLIDDDYIEIGVECENLGWCAVGLSPNGQMPQSDIMFFWVDEDGAHLEDRFANGRSTPPLDASQDLLLRDGSEYNGKTYIRFYRSIYDCDDEGKDVAFEIGTDRIIYGFNANDPTSNGDGTYSFSAHTTKGYKSVNVLSGTSNVGLNIPELTTNPDSVSTFDLTVSDYTIPSDTTTYYCEIFKLPEFNDTHHIVSIEPIIQEGNEGLVHHVLMYICPYSSVNEADIGFGLDCNEWANMPGGTDDCRGGSIIYGWAIGGELFNFPEQAGLEMSGLGNINGDTLQYLFYEVHYDNPDHLEGVKDNSGFRFYYTSQLRPENAAVLWVGLSVYPTHFIPANIQTVNYGYCTSDCTSGGIDVEGGVSLFASFLHAHNVGTALKLRHIRNGTELEPIDENRNYDFNYQTTVLFDDYIQLLPGDDFILECSYDTSDRDLTTFAGIESSDEMCLVYLFVYPKPTMRRCDTRWDYGQMLEDNGDNAWDWFEGAVTNSYITDVDFSGATDYYFTYDASTQAALNYYNELWTNELYYTRYLTCTDIEGNALIPWIQRWIQVPTIDEEYVEPVTDCADIDVFEDITVGDDDDDTTPDDDDTVGDDDDTVGDDDDDTVGDDDDDTTGDDDDDTTGDDDDDTMSDPTTSSVGDDDDDDGSGGPNGNSVLSSKKLNLYLLFSLLFIATIIHFY